MLTIKTKVYVDRGHVEVVVDGLESGDRWRLMRSYGDGVWRVPDFNNVWRSSAVKTVVDTCPPRDREFVYRVDIVDADGRWYSDPVGPLDLLAATP